MRKNEFYYKSADGKTDIHAVEWLPEGQPVAILQIAHGVTEYILRYEEMAKYLTDRGIAVVGNDHLGHGSSISKGSKSMYFGPDGSWDWVVKDVHTCKELISNQFSNIPYCLLGFSLGSFVARTFLIKYPKDIDACILVGTGQIPSIQIAIAKYMAKKEAKKFGEDNTTPTIKQLTFGTYNKMFKPNRTDFDWLCASDKSLDEYIEDPMRGDCMSSGLFRELLNGMDFSGKMNNIEKMDKQIPVLFLSGDKDPVGNCGKGVEKAYNSFKKAGMSDISRKLYPGLRHDILHEDCRESIYDEIYRWMKNKIIK